MLGPAVRSAEHLTGSARPKQRVGKSGVAQFDSDALHNPWENSWRSNPLIPSSMNAAKSHLHNKSEYCYRNTIN
jgi:hypothetical protein